MKSEKLKSIPISFKIFWQVAPTIIVLMLFPAQGTSAFEGKLNLNTATIEQLQKLPFIGQAKARAIVDHRKKKGNYKDIEDLLKSPAIGQSTFEAIKPYLSLNSKDIKTPPKKIPDQTTRFVTQIITKPGEIILLPDKLYYPTLMDFILFAEKQIDVSMFIFKTTKSPKNKPSLLAKALISAAKRGVAVNVLLENSGYDDKLNEENQRVAKLLQKNKIHVRFDSPKRTTHTKVVVIDGRFCFVGSHNFTHSALAYNHELSLLIDSTNMAEEFQGYIKEIE